MSIWCRPPPTRRGQKAAGPADARCDAKGGVGAACPRPLMRFLLRTWRQALQNHHNKATRPPQPMTSAPPEALSHIEEPMRSAALEAWNAGQRVYTCNDLVVAFARPPAAAAAIVEEQRAFAAMCAWMSVARHWTRCPAAAAPLQVYMIWTDLRKTRKPTDGRGAEQANGGFAFGCGRPELVVYRREEWWKVFLHESLHAMELDQRQKEQQEQKQPTTSTAWFEAFTECWARLWYLAWTAVVRHRGSAQQQERTFQRLLAESQMFGWAQAARWNAGEGGGGGNDDDAAMMLTSPEFKEQTPGRMYFTAATALLCNLGALHRFTVAAQLMLQKEEGTAAAEEEMDDLAELIRAAVRSPTAARLRRAVRLRPPPPLTPPNSMRMTHLDASPDHAAASAVLAVRGGAATRRRSCSGGRRKK